MLSRLFVPIVSRGLAVALVSAAVLAAPAAHARLFNDDEARKAILELRERLSSVSSQANERIDRLERGVRASLDLQNEVERLRQELARLRGQNELLQNELASLQRSQKDYYRTLDERVRQIEPQSVVVDGREGSAVPAERQEFEAAQKLFRDGNFPGAAAAFSAFLRKYPQSIYEPLALYWHGNALYAQRDYRGSIAALQTMQRDYPTHQRLPDALLMIANAQIEGGQRPAAKKTLEQVAAQYGDTEAGRIARERLAGFR